MFSVICNPYAGNRRAEKILPNVLEELKSRNIEYTCFNSNDLSGTDISCGRNDTVCIVGGDGTVVDVLNRLPDRKMRLITVPCGTGNDFIKCVGLPKDPLKALKTQLDAAPRPLDMAEASGEYFLNVFGIGFDVEVLKKLDLFKTKYTGLMAYLKALVKAVKEYKPTECEISVDGGEFIKKSVSILSVGNGQYIGGGMKAVPSAQPFDGYLDVVEVKPVKRRQLLILLPSFIFGLHVKIGLGKSYRCKSIRLKGDKLSYQIDGEIRQRDSIDVKVITNKLQFGG